MGKGQERACAAPPPPVGEPLLFVGDQQPPRLDRPTIAVDLDSTLWPLLEALQQLPGGERVRYEDCRSWDDLPRLCGDPPGQRPERMLSLFAQAMTLEMQNRQGLFPGAADALLQLQAGGYAVHVMTSRPEHTAEDVRRFLQGQGAAVDLITVREDFDKVELCQQLGIRILVDDHPEELARAHRAGLSALALRFRYNAEALDRHKLDHARDWPELAAHILRHAERHHLPE